MQIEINKLTSDKIDLEFLKRVADKICKILPRACRGAEELSIVIIGDSRMRALNKKYLNKNRVTDVLAFDYGRQFGGQGEIIICLPQAKRQAKKLGHSLKEELKTLLIHGILHLAGYKDKTKKDFNKMIKKQEEIWQRVI